MKIIVAEDHLLYRKGVVSYIARLYPDAQIKEAANGAEIMSITKHFQPDIFIVDLEMPKMDGIDTISYLCSHKSDCKVLVITMHQNPNILQEVMSLGIHGLLIKGENEEDIGKAIDALMKGELFFAQTPLQFMQEKLRHRTEFRKDFDKLRLLTDREIEILKLICREMTNKEIADALSVSPRTVDSHRNSLLEKCQVKNTAGLVKFALNHQLTQRQLS